MELCSGRTPASPAMRNIRVIPVPVSPAFPPIEEWYIVARKTNGESRVFSSWEKYQEESSSINNRDSFEDGGPPELAAFPTMAQAITQLKNYSGGQQKSSEPSPSFSKLTNDRTDHININGSNDMLMGLPTNISNFVSQKPHNDDRATASFIDALVSNRIVAGSLLTSMPRKVSIAAANPRRVVDDDADRDTREGATMNASKPLPQSLLSSEEEKNARKRKAQGIQTTYGITIPSVPSNKLTIPTVPTAIAARSARTDMGDPKRNEVDTSNLDALAMAANDSNNSGRPPLRAMGRIVNSTSPTAMANKRRMVDGAQLSPTSISMRRGANGSLDTRGLISSDSLAGFSNPIIGRLNGCSDSFTVANPHKSVSTVLKIPTVPTEFSRSIKIPEVPRGFKLSPNQDSLSRTLQDLQSSIDERNKLSVSSQNFASQNFASQKLASQKLALSAMLSPASTYELYSNQRQQQQQHSLFNCQFPQSQGASAAFYRNNSFPNVDEFRQLLELSSLCGSDGGNSEMTLQHRNTSARQW
eukprot:jgi/Psemu1/43344/gm1.43344_g